MGVWDPGGDHPPLLALCCWLHVPGPDWPAPFPHQVSPENQKEECDRVVLLQVLSWENVVLNYLRIQNGMLKGVSHKI